jgi:hypothetical protein
MAQRIVSVVLFDALGFDNIAQVIKATRMTAMAYRQSIKKCDISSQAGREMAAWAHLIQFAMW